jgi:preprotein translocase subunit YajC
MAPFPSKLAAKQRLNVFLFLFFFLSYFILKRPNRKSREEYQSYIKTQTKVKTEKGKACFQP